MSLQLQVHFLGHAAFALDNGQGRLCLDPHRPGAVGGRFNLPEIVGPFDAIAITHAHEDHAGWTPALGTDRVIDSDADFAGFSLQFRAVPHDAVGGAQMGWSRMIKIRFDRWTVVHCGDIGAWTDADIEWLRGVDLLLVPVGGTYTVDGAQAAELVRRCEPKMVLPMHARDPRIDLPLAPVDDFLGACQRPVFRRSSLDLASSPEQPCTVLLDAP